MDLIVHDNVKEKKVPLKIKGLRDFALLSGEYKDKNTHEMSTFSFHFIFH